MVSAGGIGAGRTAERVRLGRRGAAGSPGQAANAGRGEKAVESNAFESPFRETNCRHCRAGIAQSQTVKLVVLDTGVLVAGVFWRHEPHLCVKAWLRGLVTPVVSGDIFAEYERVLGEV